MYYPVFLDLRGRDVLVVGAGKVALRKAQGLAEAGARVTVVAPRVEPGFADLRVTLHQRAFEPSDIASQALVFAATDDRAVNQAVAAAARARGIWCNVADAPAEGAFLVPSRIHRGDLQVAVTTSGRSPRIAASLRRQIEELLDAQLAQGLSR